MDAAITQIQQFALSNVVATVKYAFGDAMAGLGNLDPRVLQMDGMSGRKYRLFINNLMRLLPGSGYLEVGVWQGSTLCSAINGNRIAAVAIDNWSQFGGPRDAFLANLQSFRPPNAVVRVIEQDFRRVDYESIGKCRVFMFDGPHSHKDQYDGIMLALPAVTEEFVLIIDDWNWQQVRDGTLNALVNLKLSILYALEIRTTLDNTHPEQARQNSDWHNGYFIGVLLKHQSLSMQVGA
jgi:hypothetical protein